jgi:outer membrane protein TolC
VPALLVLALAPPARASGKALTFEQALEMAGSANEDVAMLGEHVKQARAIRLQVLSGLLPWLSASASIGFTEEVSLEMGGGESRVVVPGEDWGWGGVVSLQLVNLALVPSVYAADKGVDAAEALEAHGTEGVLFATAQSYVTALFADAAVAVRERELETRNKRLEEVEARMQAEQALALDLKRAELQVLEAQQVLESARVDAILAMDALCLLLGEEPGTVFTLAPLETSVAAAPQGAPSEAEVAGEIDQALEERADLEAQQLALKSAKAEKVAGWFSLLPTLSVSASYDQGPESFRAPEGSTWMVSFNMTWSIFDGGYTAGKIMENTSKSSEALLELAQFEKEIKGEVRSTWLLFRLGLANRDTAAKQLEVAADAYEMAEERYRAGVATGLEVDDALDALALAEMGLLGQEMNLQLAWLAYLRASGQFSDIFEVTS